MSSENSGIGIDTVNEVMLVIKNDIKDYYDYIPSELDDKFIELKKRES